MAKTGRERRQAEIPEHTGRIVPKALHVDFLQDFKQFFNRMASTSCQSEELLIQKEWYTLSFGHCVLSCMVALPHTIGCICFLTFTWTKFDP